MFYSAKETVATMRRKAELKGKPSESTLLKYEVNIERFFRIMKIEKIEELTMFHFEEFILKMRKRGVGNSYIANVLSAMRWLMAGYLQENEKLNDVVVANIIRPMISKQPVEYLTEEEVLRFMDCINQDLSKGSEVRKMRFLALISLLVHSGARIGEALSINKEDLDRENLCIPVIGKGNIKRNLLLTENNLLLIDRYLSMRTDTSPALFVALGRSSRWQQTDVNRTFKRYKKESGIKKKFTNHTLRHTFATLLERRGVPLTDIQVLMGHKNLRTTIDYYLGPSSFERARINLKDKHFDFIPESALKK